MTLRRVFVAAPELLLGTLGTAVSISDADLPPASDELEVAAAVDNDPAATLARLVTLFTFSSPEATGWAFLSSE